MHRGFNFARTPGVRFGAGKLKELPAIIANIGKKALLVTGTESHRMSGKWEEVTAALEKESVVWLHEKFSGEPTPDIVDEIVERNRKAGIEVVVGWGGGSVIDAGKAVSAMLRVEGSVMEFLENVGSGRVHSGVKVPYVAVPTTSGTGSEATKNAVLRRVGENGFKNSLRHENFVPDVAVIDPDLMVSCPADVTAACGMDAFTQLLEGYVSTNASPMTDALALSGMENVRDSLVRACTDGAGDVAVRGSMAYAALMSGITLANAGLGLVHGIAGPMGGMFEIPHGVACGSIAAAANEATVKKLIRENGPEHPALKKFAKAGMLLAGVEGHDTAQGCEMLLEVMWDWTRKLKMPRLGSYSIQEKDLTRIAEASNCKYNPVYMSAVEIREILKERM